MSDYDYAALGLKVGIEIHQQLDSQHKLFCRCPSRLEGTRPPDYTLMRKHRPVLGETGKFDEAMLVEFTKGASVVYEGYYDTTCTYEIDETPPFNCDEEALDIAVEICLLFKMNIIREMHVCRKNYVDGSVPGGFQRTMEIGKDGTLTLKSGKVIGIENIFLEEDAARRIKTEGKVTYFRVDRLGIPLVEITTTPDISDPQEARDAAYRIGLLLRSTGKVKKVLGSIRQDINISIREGNRIEMKGVQKLDWIPPLVQFEIQRQLALVEIQKKLKSLGLKPEDIKNIPKDLTGIFKDTQCKFVNAGIKKGQIVMGLKIPGFQGIYGIELQPNRRFGTEVASKVRVLTGLKGLIHSDEDLSGKYQFAENEISATKKELGCAENDLFVLLIGNKTELVLAFNFIVTRTQYAFKGIPPETRQAQEDGTSEFLRELHGGSRLYPDTDTLAIEIDDFQIKRIKGIIGAYPWDLIDTYAKKYKMEPNNVENLIMEGNIKLFDKLVAILPDNIALILNTIQDKITVLHREERDIDRLKDHHFLTLINGVKDNKVTKEAIEPVLRIWTQKPDLDLEDAKKEAGISDFDLSKLDGIVKDLIEKNAELVKTKGRGAMGPLMGDLMNIVGRGGVDGKLLSAKLNEGLGKFLGEGPKPSKSEKPNTAEKAKPPKKSEGGKK
jgi:glutamyl-tRNA(Gln) amidotransferase subunit E